MRYLRVVLPLLVAVMILAFSTAQTLAQMSWDNRAEFSLTQNPNGCWTYGCLDKDGKFTSYNNTFDLGDGIIGWCIDDNPDAGGNVTINTTNKPVEKFNIIWEPGQVCLHPGLFGAKTVLRWTSPGTGMVSLGLGVSARSVHGTPASIEIKHNNEVLASNTLDGFSGSGVSTRPRFGSHPDYAFSSIIRVAEGDVIDFMSSDLGMNGTGHVAVGITIAPAIGEIPASNDLLDANKLFEWNWIACDSLVDVWRRKDS